ncbi:MAG: glycosyltransferase family 39 protein, partial [Planctomycetia bacterium]
MPSESGRAGGFDLVGIVGAYLAACAVTLPWFLRRVGPDAVSYISVAMKYRDGHFADAVNGFWSPLFSWLLAPVVRLGPPPETIARCLQVLIGVGALAAIWWLCRRLELPMTIARFVTLGCVPAVVMQAVSETTPDLLVAALLTVYIGIVVAEGYPRSNGEAAAAGAVGGLAYLAKAYAFPFVLLHFSALSCWLLARRWKNP